MNAAIQRYIDSQDLTPEEAAELKKVLQDMIKELSSEYGGMVESITIGGEDGSEQVIRFNI